MAISLILPRDIMKGIFKVDIYDYDKIICLFVRNFSEIYAQYLWSI